MATNPYTSVSISGYNTNPPPDDGTTGADNQLKWSKHKDKIGDPLKNLAESINSNVLSAFAKTINTDPDQNNSVAGSIAFTSSELTISGGSITITRSHHTVDTEADASSDSLDTISNTGTNDGAYLFLRGANIARVVTIQSGSGNIFLRGGNKDLKTTHPVVLIRIGTDWHEVEYQIEPINIAQMTALKKIGLANNDMATLKGYTTIGDGGGGRFFWNSSSTATVNIFNTFASDEGGTGRWIRREKDIILSSQWGFVDGADNTTKAQAMHTYAAALSKPKKIRYNPGSSIISTEVSVTSFVDGMEVDFGNHKFDVTVSISTSAFSFGDPTNTIANPTPGNKDLRVHGGSFDQAIDATFRRFVTVYDTQSPKIHDIDMEHSGNGAIFIGVAVNDFDIYRIDSSSISGESIMRAIWINGASVVGYSGQVINTSDFTLIGTGNPTTILRGNIWDCNLRNQMYGIYLQNARDVDVYDNNIFLDPSNAQRCITVNNFSPRSNVYNNRMESSVSSTGIMFTQASTECTAYGNRFFGSFGGNRDIYVQFISEVDIHNNNFITDGTQKIQVDNGGFAIVRGNTFKRRSRVFNATLRSIFYSSLDANDLSLGGTAVEVGGLIVRNNKFHDDGICVLVDQNQSTTGANFFGAEVIDVSNNTCFRRDLANFSIGQAVLNITVNDDAKPMNFSMEDNFILPFAATIDQSQPRITGTATVSIRVTDVRMAVFNVAIVSSVVTVTKKYGDRFSLASSLSGANLLLTPRTGNGQAGVAVAEIMSIIPNDANTGFVRWQDSGASNPIAQLIDKASVVINLTVTDADVDVWLSSNAND